MSRSPAAPRRSHAERSQATQKQIIAAAIEVIDTKGLQAASMFEIAKAAGVTPGALQHHFTNKASLIQHAATELVHADDQYGDVAVWSATSPALSERAHEAVRSAWARMYSQPRYVAMWSVILGMHYEPELRQHIARERVQLRQRSLDHFLAVFPELASDADAEGFADMVFSTLRGMGLLLTFGQPPEYFDPLLDNLSHTIRLRCEAALRSAAPAKPPRRKR